MPAAPRERDLSRGGEGLTVATEITRLRPGPTRQTLIAVLLVLGLLLAAVACGSGEREVVGTVIGVEQRSLTELSSLTVRDGAGKGWSFVAQGFAGMTPSHLVEHQATRERVRVAYVEREDGALVIVKIEDA